MLCLNKGIPLKNQDFLAIARQTAATALLLFHNICEAN
jgi:hypothetical protein